MKLHITEKERHRMDIDHMGETLANAFLDYIGMFEAYDLDPRLQIVNVTAFMKRYTLTFHGLDGNVKYSYGLMESRGQVDVTDLMDTIQYLKDYFNNRDADDIEAEW